MSSTTSGWRRSAALPTAASPPRFHVLAACAPSLKGLDGPTRSTSGSLPRHPLLLPERELRHPQHLRRGLPPRRCQAQCARGKARRPTRCLRSAEAGHGVAVIPSILRPGDRRRVARHARHATSRSRCRSRWPSVGRARRSLPRYAEGFADLLACPHPRCLPRHPPTALRLASDCQPGLPDELAVASDLLENRLMMNALSACDFRGAWGVARTCGPSSEFRAQPLPRKLARTNRRATPKAQFEILRHRHLLFTLLVDDKDGEGLEQRLDPATRRRRRNRVPTQCEELLLRKAFLLVMWSRLAASYLLPARREDYKCAARAPRSRSA